MGHDLKDRAGHNHGNPAYKIRHIGEERPFAAELIDDRFPWVARVVTWM